jgi:glycosyltransferase involved in cell wall biosynthesis
MKRIVGLKIGSIDPAVPSGGQECAYEVYAQLAEEFDIHVLACKSSIRSMESHRLGTNLVETVLPLHSLTAVYISDRILGTKEILLPPWCYTGELALSVGRARFLRDELQKADLIILETWLLLPVVLKLKRPQTKILYRTQNVDSIFFKPMVPVWFWKQRKAFVQRYEKDALSKCDAVAPVSEEDKKGFWDLYRIPGEKITVIPLGANTSEFEPETERRDEIRRRYVPGGEPICAFIGTGIAHNNETAIYIATRLAPQLPECVFLIMGKCADALKGLPLPDNVRAVGFVTREDFRAVLAGIDVAVNPVISGSGMNIKMLTYLTAGIPTVTSPFGARGIDIEDGTHALVADLPKFPEKVRQILKDAALRKHLSQESRKLALTRYDLQAIGNKARDLCRQLIGN